MNEYNRGDIYWIDPCTECPEKGNSCYSHYPKSRPGIIVSNNTGNKNSDIVEVVFLTTKHKPDLATHTIIKSGLKFPSTAMCEQITTVSINHLKNKIGECTKLEMDAIEICMYISLGMHYLSRDLQTKEETTVLSTVKVKEVTPELDQAEDTIKKLKEEIERLKEENNKLQIRTEIFEELYVKTVEQNAKK